MPILRYEVEMLAFGEPGEIRIVDIPAHRMPPNASILDILALIFEYGQNDFQPKNRPSVSVGDVIRYSNGGRYYVAGVGFAEVDPYNNELRALKMDGTIGMSLGFLRAR